MTNKKPDLWGNTDAYENYTEKAYTEKGDGGIIF